jgi:diguanylate cyclase (GGDEF)-like protein
LWSLTIPAVSLVLLVDLLAVGYGVWLFAGLTSFDGIDVVIALVATALITVEGARRVESRRSRGGALHKDLGPAWIVAAAIVLEPALALIVALVLRAWWRIRAGRCIPHRWAYSTAVVVLAIGAAHATFSAMTAAFGGSDAGVVAAMVTAALVYLAVDSVLCGIAIRLMIPGSTRQEMFGELDDVTVDLTSGGLGCLVAAAVMINPWSAIFAIPITLAAQRALLLGQLETEAQTDAKTRLSRIDWWRKHTEVLLRQARNQNGRVAILLIDIDHFKQINDRHGHLAGDEALRAIATILRGAIRSKDLIGRFGGEEFVIALPDTDASDAAVTAGRLRTAVANSPLGAMLAGVLDNPRLDPESVRLTVSIGVAVYPTDGQTVDALLERADRAMYAAKAAGRDRVKHAADCLAPPVLHAVDKAG